MKAFFEANKESSYKAFNEKLIPTLEREKIIGVRVPLLRKKAKLMLKEGQSEAFLLDLPHYYFEENLLHAYLVNEEKNLSCLIQKLEAFLPYVDNWAVCDSLSPKIFKKEKRVSFKYSKHCFLSEHTYQVRFGILNVMKNFLDKDFDKAHLSLIGGLKGEDYYLKMAKAWYFAEAFSKQYEATYCYFNKNELDFWTHNKAIQKAIESRKISNETKEKLRRLKRKND